MAYPGLCIVHRPGQIHSNVDPLSWLPRVPPHSSPTHDDIEHFAPEADKVKLVQKAEDRSSTTPAKKAVFTVWWWEEVIEKHSYKARRKKSKKALPTKLTEQAENSPNGAEDLSSPDLPFPIEDHWTYPPGVLPTDIIPSEDWNTRSHLLVSMNPKLVEEFSKAYHLDLYFTKRLAIEAPQSQKVLSPSRFQQGNNGLLYFINANWNTRLCMPKSQVNFVLQWAHETASESAHAGPRRFLA